MTKRQKITVPEGVPDRWDTCLDCKAKKLKGTECGRSKCPGRKARARSANA